ncbi:MAG: tRNA (adenosine(37)-N6)-threonylcarbamoyltransferase complex ATPase subunit type 1 TsaE [Rhodospirillales bacterium RIFCSPLOWO2_12_FULL_58_28]|nr:MAG: tRNA (adenosine(37)-N6)-threonylcarbamoyltransferase complex ATPase subunit type 1 TsaE [Rhodospirillales bacterium RIFCSPLOWO2_02_FULL_58_16]OHC78217.1 MAG: tRNA (adenosine(37)-N6)-threonylcarbamoyltransferase complex ATPase subunit type 1 TsaE [Rhodospirillales bacterium RIFCSPLOWO2_12_FULL_58_28]
MTDHIELDLTDEAATDRLAVWLAGMARVGDVIALRGELGCGKTAFARAFIRARAKRQEEVPSPTFTLLQTYDLDGGMVHHFDLYRLNAAEEALELGIEEAFAEGISLIEWPERLGGFLPKVRLDVALAYAEKPEARHLTLTGYGDWPDRLKELM